MIAYLGLGIVLRALMKVRVIWISGCNTSVLKIRVFPHCEADVTV